MTLDLFKQRVDAFLTSKEPSVLCISGDWGVGKTYTWRRLLKDAKAAQRIGLESYSYVSLFGVNSLDSLRFAVFENRIPRKKIGEKLSAKEIEALARQHQGTIRAVASNLPWGLGGIIDSIAPLVLQTIREQIICLDDLERKGPDLTMREVLGLVSFFVEERDCQIVILSNTNAFEGEDKTDFQEQLEKVVDEMLVFQPTPDDCASIALGDAYPVLKERSIALGISNIRVIAKIRRLYDAMLPAFKGLHESVLAHAVHYITVLGWVRYSKNAPPIEFITHRVSGRFTRLLAQRKGDSVEEPPPEQAAWNSLLDAYGMHDLDAIGLVLWNGVQQGFFDLEALKNEAGELQKAAEHQEAEAAQRAAWATYHDSFLDNEAEVIDAIYNTILANVKYVSLVNLDGAMSIMRDLGRDDIAEKLLTEYMEKNADNRHKFDIEGQRVFANQIQDASLVPKVRAKYESFADARKTLDAVLTVGAHGGNPEDYRVASRVSVDDLVKAFKERRGDELRALIKACIASDTIINAREEEREVSAKAKEALRCIGEENTLNALRVSRYGVGPKAKSKSE